MNAWGTEHEDAASLTRFEIRGQDEAWDRMHSTVLKAIEAVVEKIAEDVWNAPPQSTSAGTAVARDMAELASSWVQARVQRPSLENEQIRADITLKYAEAARAAAEADKLRAETSTIADALRSKRIADALETLERLLRLARDQGGLAAGRVLGDLHMTAGFVPSDLLLNKPSSEPPSDGRVVPDSHA